MCSLCCILLQARRWERSRLASTKVCRPKIDRKHAGLKNQKQSSLRSRRGGRKKQNNGWAINGSGFYGLDAGRQRRVFAACASGRLLEHPLFGPVSGGKVVCVRLCNVPNETPHAQLLFLRVIILFSCWFRFIKVLDHIDGRVENLRREALHLQTHADLLTTSIDLLKNHEHLQTLTESKSLRVVGGVLFI